MMVVATPRDTMASQLKKGTVQLNVLQREEKRAVNRQGKAHFSQTCRERVESQQGHFNTFQTKQADLDALALQTHHTHWNCVEGNNFT